VYDRQEIAEGKMLIDAAKAAGVTRLIWSGLPAVSKISGGKYTDVYHFDGKAVVTEYARQSGVPFINVMAGMYAQNHVNNPLLMSKELDGSFAISLPVRPKSQLPMIDIRDYGLYVRKALELPVFPNGSDVCTGINISAEDMAAQLSEGE
jgi:uncharacterized protein YbjT (DUF2867 family)